MDRVRGRTAGPPEGRLELRRQARVEHVRSRAASPRAARRTRTSTARWTGASRFANGEPALIEEDANEDGKPELRAEFGPDGKKTLEHQDPDSDGRVDVTITFVNGVKTRVEEDTNRDGKVDVTHRLRRRADRAPRAPTRTATAASTRVSTLRERRRAAPGARPGRRRRGPSWWRPSRPTARASSEDDRRRRRRPRRAAPRLQRTARGCARKRTRQGRRARGR